MKKNIPNTLADELLLSIGEIQEAQTDLFFYTRLKARMEKENEQSISLSLKPVWLVSLLGAVLFINTFFLVQQDKEKPAATTESSALQNFATNYDLTVSTSF